MNDRMSGPSYDPLRPRTLTRSQAEDARFYTYIGHLLRLRLDRIFADAARDRARRACELEQLSHAEAIERLGYRPDEALIRTRKALPPQSSAVRAKRSWWPW